MNNTKLILNYQGGHSNSFRSNSEPLEIFYSQMNNGSELLFGSTVPTIDSNLYLTIKLHNRTDTKLAISFDCYEKTYLKIHITEKSEIIHISAMD